MTTLLSSFDELELHESLKRAIAELGFATPTPIQAETLPILLGEPTDFLGLAATGTGKTAAFSIPLLEKLQAPELSSRGVKALVLCPTRELAIQVAGQLNLLARYLKTKALPVYGGAPYHEQIRGLRDGAQIVVGTPGRVVDHLERGTLDLSDLQLVVLDEADEMISMGFKDDLETILSQASEGTQKWLFSATMSPEVRRVADEYLRDPAQVQVNRTEMLPDSLEQIYYPVRESDKPEILCKLIDAADDFYGIVFCQTKALVSDLTQYLVDRGYRVDCLHGDKDQNARERTMKAFRERKVTMLVCTDVAARGIDVKDITHVINYSLPRELDSYVHRIGRTARSGKTGFAMSLVTPSHRGLVKRIERMTKSTMREGKLPTRKEIGMKKVSALRTKFLDQGNYQRAIDLMGDDWKETLANTSVEEIAGRFLALAFPEVFADRDAKASGTEERSSRDRPRIQSSPKSQILIQAVASGSGRKIEAKATPVEAAPAESSIESPLNEALIESLDRALDGGPEEPTEEVSVEEVSAAAAPVARVSPSILIKAGTATDRPARAPYGKKTFGDKKPWGEKKSWGDKKPWGEKKSFGDRKPWGEKKAWGDKKPWVDKKPWGERPAYLDRKPKSWSEKNFSNGDSGQPADRSSRYTAARDQDRARQPKFFEKKERNYDRKSPQPWGAYPRRKRDDESSDQPRFGKIEA